MDLEKQWLENMKEAVDMEPVNNMGKWAKQTKIESIAEKLDWIGKVKKQGEEGFDSESNPSPPINSKYGPSVPAELALSTEIFPFVGRAFSN